MGTKSLDRRFGVVAVEKGFITADQFIDAMKIQILGDMEGSKHRLIGTILVEMARVSGTIFTLPPCPMDAKDLRSWL